MAQTTWLWADAAEAAVPSSKAMLDALRQGVLAFFDAELLDDLEARAYLAPDGPYARSLGLGDRYTVKPAH